MRDLGGGKGLIRWRGRDSAGRGTKEQRQEDIQIEGRAHTESPEIGESEVNWRGQKQPGQWGTSARGREGGMQWGRIAGEGPRGSLGALKLLILSVRAVRHSQITPR